MLLIKDPEQLWFKGKTYGWGWVPVRWQGWLTVAAFVAFLIWNGNTITATSSGIDIRWFLVRVFGAVAVLLALCYATGEKPRFRWGKKK